MWIEVGSTNNDLFVIAQYYLVCLRQVGGIPKIIRADCGTEKKMLTWLFYNQDQSFSYRKSSILINTWRPGGVCLSGEVWLGGFIFSKI